MSVDYCQAARQAVRSIEGQNYLYLGFTFAAPVRVALHAPGEGWFEHARCGSSVSGLRFRTRNESWDFTGRLSPVSTIYRPVKAGEVLGYVDASETKVIGPYDLIFSVFGSRRVMESRLTRLFPQAFTNPVAPASFEAPSCVTVDHGNIPPDQRKPSDNPWFPYPDLQ